MIYTNPSDMFVDESKAFWRPQNAIHARALVMDNHNEVKWRAETEETIAEIFAHAGEVKPDRALEIGCGVGRLMAEMAGKFKHVSGVDISAGMVEEAKLYLRNLKNTLVKTTDGKSIGFADNYFDFIYSYITFQHINSLRMIRLYVLEIRRMLKPGGKVVVQSIQGGNLEDGQFHGARGHYFKNIEEFGNMFAQAGLHIESLDKKDNVLWVTASKAAEQEKKS